MAKSVAPLPGLSGRETNFVFLGEAGTGKSEIAANLAFRLAEAGEEVHFFDMDMTKPLFRSRDLEAVFAEKGVTLHYEEQFMDAPTLVGGVRQLMRGSTPTVLDIGGDYIGARSVGRYAPLLNDADTAVYYVLNPYRPWCDTLEHIDMVLSQVLAVTHVRPETLHLIANPNLGPTTSAEDVLSGAARLRTLLEGTLPLDFICAEERLCAQLRERGEDPFHLTLYLTYPWEQPGDGTK